MCELLYVRQRAVALVRGGRARIWRRGLCGRATIVLGLLDLGYKRAEERGGTVSLPGLLRLALALFGPPTEALQSLEHRLALLEHSEHLALDGLLPSEHLELALLLAHLLHLLLLPPPLPPPRELDLP